MIEVAHTYSVFYQVLKALLHKAAYRGPRFAQKNYESITKVKCRTGCWFTPFHISGARFFTVLYFLSLDFSNLFFGLFCKFNSLTCQTSYLDPPLFSYWLRLPLVCHFRHMVRLHECCYILVSNCRVNSAYIL